MEHSLESSLHAYRFVYLALVVLLVLTVGGSFLEFSLAWAAVIALGIAGIKGALIVLYFMEARKSRALVLTVAATLVFLATLLALSLSDFLAR